MTMPETTEITDSSDWAKTSVPGLCTLDETLRCRVCREFMSAPMITPCGHNFCSLCVRRMLVKSQRCPQCMATTYESQLKKNSGLEACIDAFVKVRPDLFIQLKYPNVNQKPASKQDSENTLDDQNESLPAINGSRKREREDDREAESSFSNKSVKVERIAARPSYPPGHAACPVCQRVLPISQIQGSHISNCLSGIDSDTPSIQDSSFTKTSSTFATSSNSFKSKSPPSSSSGSFFGKQNQSHIHKKIPRPNDTTLTIPKLKARIAKLGIPLVPSGLGLHNHAEPTRKELLRRESEWITIWNSNTDRSKPLSRAQLLEKFNEWDRAEAAEKAANINSASLIAAQEKEQKKLEKLFFKQSGETDNAFASLPSVPDTKAQAETLKQDNSIPDELSFDEDTLSSLSSSSNSSQVFEQPKADDAAPSSRRITTRSMSKHGNTNSNTNDSDSADSAPQSSQPLKPNPIAPANAGSPAPEKLSIPPFIPKDLKSLNRKLYSLAHNSSFQELAKAAKQSLKKNKKKKKETKNTGDEKEEGNGNSDTNGDAKMETETIQSVDVSVNKS